MINGYKMIGQINKSSHIEWEMGMDFTPPGASNDAYDWPTEIMQTSDGGYIIAGWYNGKNCLVKFANNGTKLWQYQLSYTIAGYGFNSIVEVGNYYIAAGLCRYGSPADPNGVLLKIEKNGDPTTVRVKNFKKNTATAYVGLALVMDFSKVVTTNIANEIVVCGKINNRGYGEYFDAKSKGFVFGININKINDIITSNPPKYAFDDLLLAGSELTWFSRIGRYQETTLVSPSNSANLIFQGGTLPNQNFNEITTNRINANAAIPFCLSEPSLTDLANIPVTSKYNKGYLINNVVIEPTSATTYNVYVTGGASWHYFISTVFNDGAATPTPMGFRASDVFAAKYTVTPTTPTNEIIAPSVIKAYDKSAISVNASNQAAFEYAYSNHSTRNPNLNFASLTPGQNIELKNRVRFLYSTQKNSGEYIELSSASTNALMIAATYNFMYRNLSSGFNNATIFGTTDALETAFGGDYHDGDFGAFEIDKTTLEPIQANNYVTLLGHQSGDDFKLKLKSLNNKDFYFSTTTGDVFPVRDFPNNMEDFYVGKFNISTTGIITKKWTRDIYVPGNGNGGSAAMGMCGFGMDITKNAANEDHGLIVCGNNNLKGDNYTIIKMSPDYQSENIAYTATPINYKPYNGPVIIATNTTYSSTTIVSGVPIIVNSGITLTIDNSIIRFANSQWLYDMQDLNFNSVDANPHHGGFVGIIVQPGGHLIITNNSKVTGFDDNTMWDGIIIKGSNTTQMINDGTNVNCIVGNGCIIEHARNGITTDNRVYNSNHNLDRISYYNSVNTMTGNWFKSAPISNKVGTEGGGFIFAKYATFLNNENDLDFGNYTLFRNWSQVQNCNFTANAPLPNLQYVDEDGEMLGTRQHINIDNNSGLRFYSSHFTGYNPNLFASPTTSLNYAHKLSNGIIANNSDLTVDKAYSTGSTPPSFNNLYHAIEVLHGGNVALLPSYVLNSQFGRNPSNTALSLPNIENIFVNGTNPYGTNIHFNTISVANNDVSGTNNSVPMLPYGIDLQGEKGVTCENNIIQGEGKTADNYGIIMTDCGANDKKVRLNTIDNVQHGAVSLWVNNNYPSTQTLSQGLVWQCNTFQTLSDRGIEVLSSTPIGNIVYNSGINYNQGACATSTDLAANNRFYFTGSFPNAKLDQDGSADPNGFKYTFYGQANEFDPNPAVNPIIDATTCDPTLLPFNFFEQNCKSTAIPSPYVNPDTWNVIGHHGTLHTPSDDHFPYRMAAAHGQASILSAILDAGDAATLQAYINNPSITAGMLRQYLLAAGPYLSKNILQLAIARNFNPLSNAQLAEVVLANSPLPDEVYNQLEIVRPTVSGNYAIVQAQYPEYSPREILELQINTLMAEVNYNAKYARWEAMDKLNPDYNTTGNLLLTPNYKIDAAYMYTAAQNYSAASAVLAALVPSTLEETDEKAIATMVLAAKQNNTGIPAMLATNATALNAIALHHTPSAYNAQTLLSALPNTTKPIAVKPSASQSQFKTDIVKQKRKFVVSNYDDLLADNAINFYPIPVSEYLNIDYKFKNVPNYAEVKIYNVLGKLVFSNTLVIDKNKATFNLADLPNGVYHAQVFNNDSKIFTQKFVIQH